MSNTARSYRAYPDFDDEEDNYPARRPNVPGDPRAAMPGYRPAAPRLLGGIEAPTRPVNVPQPIPGAGIRKTSNMPVVASPRPNLPVPPRTPGFDQAPRKNVRNRPNLLQSLNLSNVNTLKIGMVVVGAVVAVALIFVVVSNVINWWNTWQDDMTYGRPRTMQLDAWVGHNEQTGQPTHFIAQNINGEVNIYEIPGGDTAKMTVIKGPRLFSKNADLIPVKIRLEDTNADGHVDLIASVDGQQLVYINENGRFRQATPEELGRIKLGGGK